VPKGWFLQVTPGTAFVTLAGAVANDVHGKNHHVRGTFGRHVLSLGLVRSDREPIVCSLRENPDLFSATIGGLGLTGFISWVELQLMPIASAIMNVTSQRFGSLGEFFSLSQELEARFEYGVAWVDSTASATSLGRGVYEVADHAGSGGFEGGAARRMSVPFNSGVSLVNGFSTRVFNTAKWHLASASQRRHAQSMRSFFHPLDGIGHWNRLYGRRGFQQFQCVIPEETAEPGIRDLLHEISRSGLASFLAVLKRCGRVPSPGLLSFPMAGTSLAIDFPQSRDLVERLLPRLDAIVRAAKGRLYPAKDAHMRGEGFRMAYPAWTTVDALRDPAIRSRFWDRVTA
jgi:FAD/FMN-containing dehydrogenase